MPITTPNEEAMHSYREVTLTPTLDTNAYTAGDVLFDRTAITPCWIKDCNLELMQVQVLDTDDQAAAQMELYFLDANQTLGTANAAPSVSDTNAAYIQGPLIIYSTDWIDLGGSKVARINPGSPGLPMLLSPVSDTATIYVAAITRGTPTHTASGLKFRFWFRDVR